MAQNAQRNIATPRNLSQERRTEILEAFLRCIGRHGLNGSSMRRIAAEAGVSQPLIMHHFGSRAGLVEALVAWVLTDYDDALARSLADADDAEALLDGLFGPRAEEIASRNHPLFNELHAEAARDEATKALIEEVYTRFQGELTDHLQRMRPDASTDQCERVAYGLICLVEGNDTLRALSISGHDPEAALRLARQLVASLGSVD